MTLATRHKVDNELDYKAPRADRAEALKRALEAKGFLPEGYLEDWNNTAENVFSPRRGAELVAHAWTDPKFRELLLTDGTAAVGQYGYLGPQGEYIVALEDTPALKHVIVCSMCSCTAWPILGLSPTWYKSFEYRSRVVREPRKVLAEMGTEVPEGVEIRVVDVTADTRFMVLPVRPEGTEGWSREQLAEIVTKDCLIGVAIPQVA